ncbi:MAG: DUF4349 domain-containing protein [Pirellulaceae bacterium]
MSRYHSLGVLFLFLAGCGAGGGVSNQAVSEAAVTSVLQKGNPAIAAAGAELPAADKQGRRKVIYKGSLDLVVKDFAQAEQGLMSIIEKSQAFIDELTEDRRSGSQRYAKWVVRVPAEGVQKFLDQTAGLGLTQYRGLSADDVTEEFVDLAARTKSKQQLETRLLELVAAKAGDIRDLASLETELARVREEIERMEGRVRYLSDRVAMSTITITMREEQPQAPYVAPVPPTFATRISQVFFQSLTTLRELGEEFVLCVVAIAPFALVILLLGSPIAWLFYRLARRGPRSVVPQIV